MQDKIELILQKPKGCVYACQAMVTGKSYDEIEAEYKKYNDIPDIRGEVRQWVRMGYLPRLIHDVFFEGFLYLATVPSLNHAGVLHRIVVDTRKDETVIYDPQKGNEGMKYYDTLEDLKGWTEVTFVENCFQKPSSIH